MSKGKQTCRILKDIRRQIAEANDIEYITSECRYMGDCLGTCPKCEAEVRYLEEQLKQRRMKGKMITLTGISAGMLSMLPLSAAAQEMQSTDSIIVQTTDSTISDTSEEEDFVLPGVIETMPEFRNGGIAGLMRFLEKNIRYPNPEPGIQGSVILQFTITKDGSVADAKVLKGIHPLFDKEALRVVNSMPQWAPGMIRGKAIEMKYTLPIHFKMPDIQVPQDSILVESLIKDEQGSPISGASILEEPFEGEVFDIIPQFPGKGKLMEFLQREIKYPGYPDTTETIHCCIYIGENGYVGFDDIFLYNLKKDTLLLNECKRIMSMMPRWQPAVQDGKRVRVERWFRITLKIDNTPDEENKEITITPLNETVAELPENKKTFLHNLLKVEIKMNRPIYQGEADLPVFAKVRFTVDEEGNLLYPSIIRGIDPYLDKKALEIINGKLLKQMPRWNPATLRGENIASSIVLPIRYILIYK